MTSATPRKPPSDARRAAKPKPAAADSPFLRVHHSVALREKTLAVLDELEAAADATACREALADLAVEMTRHGLDGFFMVPLKHAKVGFIVEQSASLGIVGVHQVMGSVIRKVIGRMDHGQLLSVSTSIRGFMR